MSAATTVVAPDWLVAARSNHKFTDLTINCDAREFKVHRFVMCSQSSSFEVACFGGFSEAQTAEVTLHEESGVIERLIEFCYCASYTQSSNEPLMQHVNMFAAAIKYGIPDLARLAESLFEKEMNLSPNFDAFLRTINLIYSSTSDAERSLRDRAVKHARSRIFFFTAVQPQFDAWRNTCLEMPEFSFEVLQYAARHPPAAFCLQCCDQFSLLQDGIKLSCPKCGALARTTIGNWPMSPVT